MQDAESNLSCFLIYSLYQKSLVGTVRDKEVSWDEPVSQKSRTTGAKKVADQFSYFRPLSEIPPGFKPDGNLKPGLMESNDHRWKYRNRVEFGITGGDPRNR